MYLNAFFIVIKCVISQYSKRLRFRGKRRYGLRNKSLFKCQKNCPGSIYWLFYAPEIKAQHRAFCVWVYRLPSGRLGPVTHQPITIKQSTTRTKKRGREKTRTWNVFCDIIRDCLLYPTMADTNVLLEYNRDSHIHDITELILNKTLRRGRKHEWTEAARNHANYCFVLKICDNNIFNDDNFNHKIYFNTRESS